MGAKPTADPILLRVKVREALAIAPGYGKSEAVLLDGCNRLMGGGVDLPGLQTALEWNHGKEYVRRETNEDTDVVEWFITEHGLAKQNIK